MDETTNQEEGLLSTITRVTRTLREAVENRVELFLLEAKEDRLRLLDALCLGVIGVALGLLTLILATFTVVVIFWDTEYRLPVLIAMTLIYGIAATVTFVKLRSRLTHWQSFPATLEQLEKDRACFKTRN